MGTVDHDILIHVMAASFEARVEFEVEDALAAIDLFWRNGWTDGLPIIPPTPDLVSQMLLPHSHRNAA